MEGYISIRSTPGARSGRAPPSRFMTALRDGTAKTVALRDGELISDGWRDRLRDCRRSVRGRMIIAGIAAIVVIAVVGWLGFSEWGRRNAALRDVV